MRQLRILVVHEVNYLSKIIYEFQILPEILSILGHDVTIVDYDDNWRRDPQARGTTLRTQTYRSVHRAYANASVTVRRPGMVRFPLVSRISGSVTATCEVRRLLLHEKPDAILLYGIPTIGVQTLLLARKRRVPVVCRAIDVTHELVPNRLLVPFTHVLAKYVYTRADLNAVVTPHLKNYVRSYGVKESRIRLLPSGVDQEMFSPGRPSHGVQQALGISPDQRVILFMGTMYRFSGLDRVIRGFSELIVKFPNTKLVIAGSGEDESRLKQLARECGVDSHVIFAGLLPYADLPDLIRTSEICINPFELNGVTERILPTKLFQYLSCGKPVVATELPGTIPFLKGEEHGIVYTQPENFLSALMKLLADPERRDRLGKNGAAAVGNYGWRQIAQKVEEWMNELRQTMR